MDFRHLIVTCLFSKLRLPFDNQKVKENYAIFSNKCRGIWRYDNPFVPALIHYDAKQDKGMFS